MSDRVLGYLGSTRNILGCVGLYGAGALIAPPDRVRLTISHAEVETRHLRADLDALLKKVQDAQRFPADVLAKVTELAEVLRAILTRAETLTSSPDHLHVVSQAIRDYLPSSLEAYANLPRTYALSRRAERQRSAHEELLAQLDLLGSELGKIADAVYQGDEQALRDQGRFLRDRFGGSDLDL
jgi:cob(I)alamin adenosyltransferase